MRGLIFLIFSVMILTASVYSLPIYVKPLDGAGLVQPNTNFNYQFNFTSDIACNNVILSNSSTILTDSTGIGFTDINITALTSIPSYLCEYRSGVLRQVHTLPNQIFFNVYANSANFTNNVTANWFHGFINYSDIQNAPIPTGDNSSFNQSFTDTLYYSIFNPLNFINSSYGNTTYYSASNPYGFYNSSTLPPSSGDNSSWNESYANTLYYSITNPFGFYNSSTIPALGNTTSQIWGVINNNTFMRFSDWNSTNTSYYLASNPYGFYNSSTLPPNGDNSSWNQSFANTLYYSINNPNGYWNSTSNQFNKTYADTLYVLIGTKLGNTTSEIWGVINNNTFMPIGTQTGNTTSQIWAVIDNNTFMRSSDWNATNSSYYLNSNPYGFYNSSTLPPNGDNSSWNESYANTLYLMIGTKLGNTTSEIWGVVNNNTFMPIGTQTGNTTSEIWAVIDNSTFAKYQFDGNNFNGSGNFNTTGDIRVSNIGINTDYLSNAAINSLQNIITTNTQSFGIKSTVVHSGTATSLRGAYGMYFIENLSGTNAGLIEIGNGIYFQLNSNATLNNANLQVLYRGVATSVDYTGTLTNVDWIKLYGTENFVRGDLGTTEDTTHYGTYTNVTGSADNNYGLYLETSGATNNYDVYASSANAQNYFNGEILGNNNLSLNGSIKLTALSQNPSTPSANDLKIFALQTQGHTRPNYMDDDNFTVTLGRDNFIIARNTAGFKINKSQAVYVSGSTGNVPNIALAKANNISTLPAVGIVVQDINDNAYGYVMLLGILTQIDTSSFTSGNRIYVSPTVAGSLTNVEPSYPNYVQRMGSVLVSGVGNGAIEVTAAPFVGGEATGTTNNFNSSGNISAVYFFGDASHMTGLPSSGGNTTSEIWAVVNNNTFMPIGTKTGNTTIEIWNVANNNSFIKVGTKLGNTTSEIWGVINNNTFLRASAWNATNSSYYLASNPFSFYNSSTIPALGNTTAQIWAVADNNTFAKYQFGANNFNGTGGFTTTGTINATAMNVNGNNFILAGAANRYIKMDTMDASNNSGLYFIGAATAVHNFVVMGTGSTSRGGFVAQYGGAWGGNQTQVYHDGSNGYVYTGAGKLILDPTGNAVLIKGESIATNETRGTLILDAFYQSPTAINSIDWQYSGQTARPLRIGGNFDAGGAGMEMSFYTSTLYTNDGTKKLTIDMNGNLNVTVGNLTMFNGLLKLNAITLPTCAAGTAGSIGRNTTGLYYCNSTVWKNLA